MRSKEKNNKNRIEKEKLMK